jgi:NADH-quinone oxidoreductase subunit M
MQFINSNILSFLVFMPLIAAGILLVCPSVNVAKWVAMGAAILGLLGGLHVWYWFDGTSAALQFVASYEWIPSLGIKYIVGIDGISLLLVVLTTFLMPLVLLSQWHVDEPKQKVFLSFLLALQSGMLGALVAMDMVFFYVFWEAMLIPMYFIIGVWGGKRRIYAATKFVLYTVLGSLLMLAAAVLLYFAHFKQTGIYSTSLLDLYQVRLPLAAQTWMFAAFAVAFAIKVPMWPFHTWLPDAHVEAPTVGSVILAGVLLKMGTYGLLRFAIPLFPEAMIHAAPLLVFCGVVGIIYGALTAWVQKDAKKMVAYSSVSHLGFVVIGSFAVMAGGTLSVEALTGATYQMINHGISTGALFFLVGVIYERRHTRLLSDFGGLAENMPWFAVILIVATLSSVGLPGTGGFVGEFLILNGVFQAMPIAGMFASLGVLLGAVYMLTLCRKILFGPLDNPENKGLKDLNAREFGYLVPLALLAILMGVFPNAFMGKTKPSIEHMAKNFKNYSLDYRMGYDTPAKSSN